MSKIHKSLNYVHLETIYFKYSEFGRFTTIQVSKTFSYENQFRLVFVSENQGWWFSHFRHLLNLMSLHNHLKDNEEKIKQLKMLANSFCTFIRLTNWNKINKLRQLNQLGPKIHLESDWNHILIDFYNPNSLLESISLGQIW